ncbi:MAG: hypothetical protein K0S27_152 [Gammaproteobacteria bacterium]|jgi:hypothetical protein|nr:hypothetical protein [Gammaproteobacteria bacterium]
MATHRQNKLTAPVDPKKEFLRALRPLRRVTWITDFIKKVEQPQTHMPEGSQANTEKFILGLSISLCLFMKNHSSLMRYGKALRNYTNAHAAHVLATEAPLVRNKLQELFNKFSK